MSAIWEAPQKANFQRLSDAVCYAMCQWGFHIIDYIDYYFGVGIPHIARMSFVSLFDLLKDLGLTISDKYSSGLPG